MEDLFYYYGIFFITYCIYLVVTGLISEQDAEADIDLNNPNPTEELRKRINTSVVILLANLVWIFIGLFTDESIAFIVMFSSILITSVLSVFYTGMIKKISLLGNMILIILASGILFRHFII